MEEATGVTRALPGDAPTLLQEVQRKLHAHPAISPTLILVAAWITFTVINPRFLQPGALSLLVQQTAIVAILAVGQTLILLTAGIDLSVGAVCVLAAMVMAKITSEQGVPGVLAILIGIVVAMAAGLLNGVLVTRLKLPPFIVTLGTLSIFTAIALLYSKGATIEAGVLPGELNATGHTWSVGAFRITAGVLLVLLVYVVVGVALRKTAWGRHVYAVGDDAQAAGLAGVRVGRVLLSVYVVAGVIYGIGAWVMIGRVGGASPNAVVDANLESITAVVIGGTSLFGGRGGVLGTLLGALIVQSFSVGLALAGVDGQFRLLAVGILVILAVSVDQWIRQVKA
jgi:fructose transport system permease protein